MFIFLFFILLASIVFYGIQEVTHPIEQVSHLCFYKKERIA